MIDARSALAANLILVVITILAFGARVMTSDATSQAIPGSQMAAGAATATLAAALVDTPTATATPFPSPTATPVPPTRTPLPTSTSAPTETPTAVPPTATPTPITHTVQEGDVLWNLARQYGVTVDDIVAANDLEDPDSLSIDQVLIIPRPATPTP